MSGLGPLQDQAGIELWKGDLVADPEWTVLLTNDDGIGAEGIQVMRRALLEEGARVFTLAPEEGHSCGGHRVTVDGYLEVRRLSGRSNHLSCSGTPADCVRAGILGRVVPFPDVVVSGINHGANAGDDVHYSGTVAAASEAALLGVPAMAVSQNGDGFAVPFVAQMPRQFVDTRLAARLARCIAEGGLPNRTVINLNLPSVQSGLRPEPALIGRRRWRSAEIHKVDVAKESDVILLKPWASDAEPEWTAGTDFSFLREGRASISILGVDGGMRDMLDVHRAELDSLIAAAAYEKSSTPDQLDARS